MALTVEEPDADDPIIAELGDPAWSAWMHDNFFGPSTCPSSGDARSYASRLFDYGATGRDQLAWVIERLRADPAVAVGDDHDVRAADDTSYIPCVSMLDFWAPDGALELVVYAHSLDFGKKAYGNLVELARLQERVAGELGLPVGRLTVLVKSAHVYEPELELMERLGAEAARPRRRSRA